MTNKNQTGDKLNFKVSERKIDKYGNFRIGNGGLWQCSEETFKRVKIGDTVRGIHVNKTYGDEGKTFWWIDEVEVVTPTSERSRNVSSESIAEKNHKILQLETDVAEVKRIIKQAFPATKESAIQTIHMIMLKWEISPDDLGVE